MISSGAELTYAECRDRAEALALALRERGIDRFGAYLSDPADVLLALSASSAIGAEACIYSTELDEAGVEATAEAFDHEVVLTDEGSGLLIAQAQRIDELAPSGNAGLGPVPEHTPVLILTTGTTGEPKGARHDWRRLVETVRHPDERPGERWLLAYNLNQFAGIQVVLHALVSGATLVAAPTRRPADVIETVREHEVTSVSATPTFWRLLAGSLDEESARELPLRQITLGGEAVPGALIERLRRFFPEAKISQIYGATEFGTAVSVRDGRPGLPLSVLERDDDAPVQLRIVDGELQVRTKIGMEGYYKGGDATEGWRPTGDLVEIRGDRIMFVGRNTEIINVGGAKVHPLPIEEAASAVEGVALASAYGRPNPVTGQIVALDVVPEPGIDEDELEERLRAQLEEALPPQSRPRRIQFVEELEIRGNKLARLGAHGDDS